MADTKSYSNKNPPKFDETISYEAWKMDIEIWQELSDLPKAKQALAIHLSLCGKARQASVEVGIAELRKDDGVKTLMTKLDDLFLVDKSRRQFMAFQDLYKFKRSSEVNICDFVDEFERIYFRFTQQDMVLPDAVMAFMLLVACDLPENNFQLAMSAISDVTYSNMKSTLKRIFGTGLTNNAGGCYSNSDVRVKSEPVFQIAENSEKRIFYGASAGRARFVGGARGRQSYRGSMRNDGGYSEDKYQSGDSRNFNERGSNPTRQTESNVGRSYERVDQKLNPLNAAGKVSRCIVCDSRYHWARNCPHSYNKSQRNSFVAEDTETVHLSLFGHGGVEYSKKLDTLVGESFGSVVLDSGCATTVCGEEWLKYFIETLPEHELKQVRTEPTTSTFRFGDGKTVVSSRRLVLPCYIGGLKATIRTDVVDCNIPLLLSRDAMKRAKMNINFENDTAELLGKTINLISTSSGHYCLPISR